MSFTLSSVQEGFSTYFPRLNTPIHGYINWSWKIDEIERFICAFDNPYHGSSTFIGKNEVYIKNVQSDFGDGFFHPFMAGLVYKIIGNSIFVCANGGTLIVSAVIDENGKKINKDIKTGMRFFTSSNYLENAMQYDAEYDEKGLVD